MKKKTPIRLKCDEALKTGVRRIARNQIDAACRVLESNGEPHTAVHEARKSLKKIRALLRLVAPEFGRKQFRVEKLLFQDAARLLAPLRDADARVKSLDSLLKDRGLDPTNFAAVREALQADADRIARRGRRPMCRAGEILKLARSRVRRWPLGDLEWKHLVKEMRRSYSKGKKALALYQQEQTPECFHAWRKRIKELWYHLRIARALLPAAEAKRIDLFGKAGEIAGTARDFAMLRQALLAHQAEAEAALLIRAIDARLPKLQQSALKRGVRLYAETPSAFAKRLLR
ncbi:MAG: CHAD domain-containing protein [Verrucomicrobia bacterium]|nr:CHAD domain-containing protein [Verrucomicrobiota bacterium]